MKTAKTNNQQNLGLINVWKKICRSQNTPYMIVFVIAILI